MFEITDATGKRFLGGLRTVEPGETNIINFDGWCFVSLPLSSAAPRAGEFRNGVNDLWTLIAGKGDIVYPIR